MFILLAIWSPLWQPTDVTLAVGETRIVKVQPIFAGYGEPSVINWTFRTADEQVATAFVHVTGGSYTVPILGVGPGMTAIRQVMPGGKLDGVDWVKIHVTCGAEAPVVAAPQIVSTITGRPVTLSAASQYADRTTFIWYAGHIGDVSKPIDASGPQITLTPNAIGKQYVWVSATTTCSTSAAEFAIDVSPARYRPVR
jgi:hypothetical protein